MFTKQQYNRSCESELLTAELSWELPRLGAARLCEWGGDSPDLSESEGTIRTGMNQSVSAIQGAEQAAASYLAPWRQLGTGASNTLGGLYNIPGYTAVDPRQALMNTPGYQWLQEQGTQALGRYGAATGLALSGPASKSAQSYGQNLALTNAWAPYVNELNFMSGQGLGAAGQSGQFALQGAGLEANTWMQGSQALAGLQRQQALYDQQAQNSMWNDIMTGAGFMLSPAGGNILSSAGGVMPALQDTWGNMSGSYMPVTEGMPLHGAYGMSGGNQAFNVLGQGAGMMLIPALAEGGSVGGNQPALVGEKGPELFVPRTDGYIIPNYALQSGPADDYSAFAPWRRAA